MIKGLFYFFIFVFVVPIFILSLIGWKLFFPFAIAIAVFAFITFLFFVFKGLRKPLLYVFGVILFFNIVGIETVLPRFISNYVYLGLEQLQHIYLLGGRVGGLGAGTPDFKKEADHYLEVSGEIDPRLDFIVIADYGTRRESCQTWAPFGMTYYASGGSGKEHRKIYRDYEREGNRYRFRLPVGDVVEDSFCRWGGNRKEMLVFKRDEIKSKDDIVKVRRFNTSDPHILLSNEKKVYFREFDFREGNAKRRGFQVVESLSSQIYSINCDVLFNSYGKKNLLDIIPRFKLKGYKLLEQDKFNLDIVCME